MRFKKCLKKINYLSNPAFCAAVSFLRNTQASHTSIADYRENFIVREKNRMFKIEK